MKTAETRILISKMRNKDIEMKKEKLEYIGRSVPYGYINVNKQLVPDKNTSHIVYLIYDLYDKGCSYTQIANYLNDRGIVSPSYYLTYGKYIGLIENDSNKKWKRGTVSKILSNKVYNGSYKYTDKPTHPKIINDDLFNRVQLRIKQKKNSSGNDFYYHNGNIFSNKVYCGVCGRVYTMTISYNKSGIVNYLRCSSCDTRGKNKTNCSNRIAIKYEELKGIVSMFFENEIYNKIDLNKLETIYEPLLKDENIEIHRKYLKQERELLRKEIEISESEVIEGSDLIATLKNKEKNQLLILYQNRIQEIEDLLKEIYSYARKKTITNKEFYLDKYLIDSFIDKITVSELEGNTRNIDIVLK